MRMALQIIRYDGTVSPWTENYSGDKNFRKQHAALLATPNYRRLQRPKPEEVPNVCGVGLMWPVSEAAKKTKCPKRIKLLAVPVESEEIKDRPLGYFKRGQFLGPCSERIIQLSLPPKLYVLNQKELFGKLLGEKFRKRMDRLYASDRTVFPTSATSEVSVSNIELLSSEKGDVTNPEDVKRQREWVIEKSKPKKFHKPPPINRGKKVPMSVLITSVNRLYHKLRPKISKATIEEKEIEIIQKKYFTNEMMEHLIEVLAKPRKYKIHKPKIPGAVNPGALTYVASERMKQIALPVERKKAENKDYREDAFTVSPKALKAICTPRLKELALPIIRD